MNSTWHARLLTLLVLPAAAFGQQSAPTSTAPTSSPPVSSPSSSSPTSGAAAGSSFDGLDKNHDGVLSKDEFMALFSGSGSSSSNSYGGHGGHHGRGYGGGANPNGGGFGGGGFGGGAGGNPGGFGGHSTGGGPYGGGQHHGGGARGERLNPTQQFEDLDTNHDGVLSREEFAARTSSGGVSSNGANAKHGTSATPSANGDAGDSPTH